jgi:hypothetical protein
MRSRKAGSSLPLYVPVGPVPGFTFTDAGGTLSTTFDPDLAVQVANNPSGPHRLAAGKDDPGFEAARVFKEDQVFRQIGKDTGFAEIALERGFNVATYGLLNDDNPEEARVRAYQNLYNPFSSTIGTFGGIAVGLLFPYGRVATALGKGAMASGKASGAVRSVETAQSAFSGSLLDVSAKATRAARKALKARGYGRFTQNYGGGLVSAAVAEAPLSLAIAAADVVDYNKEFSAQAVVADASALWFTGMAFAGALGLAGTAARGVAGVGRRAIVGRGSEAADNILQIAANAGRRATYRGTGVIEGAAKAHLLRRGMLRVRNALKSRAAKTLTGEVLDDVETATRTFRDAGVKFDATNFKDSSALILAARDLRGAAVTKEVASMFDDVIVNADSIIVANRSWNIAETQLQGYKAQLRRWLPPKFGEEIGFAKGGITNAKLELGKVRDELLTRAKVRSVFSVQQRALAGELDTIIGQMKATGGKQALSKLFDARKAYMASGVPGLKKYAGIDGAINKLTSGNSSVQRVLSDLDEFAKPLGELDQIFKRSRQARDWVHGRDVARSVAAKYSQMQRVSESLGFDSQTLKRLVKDAEVMSRDVTIEGLHSLGNLNRARKAILANEGEGFASVLKVPTTANEAIAFGDELLDMQIATVSEFKQRTSNAFTFLLGRGTPRGALSFGAIQAYRAMTQEQKRDEFAQAREIVLHTTSSPERLIDSIAPSAGFLAAVDMEAGVAFATTVATSNGYLLQQMPRSSDPLIGPDDFSMQEVDSYLETVGALEDPASVLASARDGSVSIEAVSAIRTVYPELYTDMILDIVEFMQTRDWDKLNQNQKLGVDTFTGGALGVLRSYGPPVGPLSAQTPMQQDALGTNTQQSSPDAARLRERQSATGSQKVSAL